MVTTMRPDELLFGLLEIDTAGTVLYYGPEEDGSNGRSSPDITGLNVFTDLAFIAHVKEIRDHLNGFRTSNEPARSFNSTFFFGQTTLTVRVMLARIRERSDVGRTKSILVHIRKAS